MRLNSVLAITVKGALDFVTLEISKLRLKAPVHKLKRQNFQTNVVNLFLNEVPLDNVLYVVCQKRFLF